MIFYMQSYMGSCTYMIDAQYPKFIPNDDTDKENYPCTKASAAPNIVPLRPSPILEASQIQIIFHILAVLRCILELESRVKCNCHVFCLIMKTLKLDTLLSIGYVVRLNICKFSVCINEMIVFDDDVELKYGLECEYLSDTYFVLTITEIDMGGPIGIVSCRRGRIARDLIGVSSPTTTATTISSENETETKHESGVSTSQTQSHAHMLHAQQQLNTSFNVDAIGPTSDKCNDLRCTVT